MKNTKKVVSILLVLLMLLSVALPALANQTTVTFFDRSARSNWFIAEYHIRRQGSSDQRQVRIIQDGTNRYRVALNWGAALVVDGHFGPLTHNRVLQYQRWNGLAVDGIVGPRTWMAMRNDFIQFDLNFVW